MKEARGKIEGLEEQNAVLQEQNEARAAELTTIAEDNEQKSKELSSLRNRTTLSQQNWAKEREDLLERETATREGFEDAKQAMSDWKVLAMEERSVRENIAEKVADLEEQVESQREAYERASSERDSQSATVDGLQRALQEIQDGRFKDSARPSLRLLTVFCSSKEGIAGNRGEFAGPGREPAKTATRGRDQGHRVVDHTRVYQTGAPESIALRKGSQGKESSDREAST